MNPDLLFDKPLSEQDMALLEREFPYLCNDVAMIINRPFRFIWDPRVETAATDCKADIFMNPYYFVKGFEQVGYGSVYHEAGHILFSPFGPELLKRAMDKEDRTLYHILQIMLDRKDDILLADDSPGFAKALRGRLLYLCVNSRYEKYEGFLTKRGMNKAQMYQFLRNWPAEDVYEDFFFAAKWHKSPKFKETRRAMKQLRRKILVTATPEEFYWRALKVKNILGEWQIRNSEDERPEIEFWLFSQFFSNFARGKGELPKALLKALRQIAKLHVATVRNTGLKQLAQKLKSLNMVHPGPISVGLKNNVKVKKVKADSANHALYQKYLQQNRELLKPLMRKFRFLENPEYSELYSQYEGDLDMDEAAGIALGFPDVFTETIVERNIDAEIHLAVDTSGSMSESKLEKAKRIATLFTEAILRLSPACEGHLWGFSSEAVYDFGPASRDSGFVNLEGEGANSDTHMLKSAGSKLARSTKRRKVLLVLCDDGPDEIALVRKMTQQLLARGIIVVHFMVGVHHVPDIYPIELIYTSMEECLEEFGTALQVVVRNLR